MNLLDKTGLQRVWDKIKTKINQQSQQIENLGATFWEVVAEGDVFVMYWHGVGAQSPISIALEGTDFVAYIAS